MKNAFFDSGTIYVMQVSPNNFEKVLDILYKCSVDFRVNMTDKYVTIDSTQSGTLIAHSGDYICVSPEYYRVESCTTCEDELKKDLVKSGFTKIIMVK